MKIYVKAESKNGEFIGIISSRHGIVESHQIYCYYRTDCNFNITLKRDMMPDAKVSVYRVENGKRIDRGEVTIISKEIGRNTVSFKTEGENSFVGIILIS